MIDYLRMENPRLKCLRCLESLETRNQAFSDNYGADSQHKYDRVFTLFFLQNHPGNDSQSPHSWGELKGRGSGQARRDCADHSDLLRPAWWWQQDRAAKCDPQGEMRLSGRLWEHSYNMPPYSHPSVICMHTHAYPFTRMPEDCHVTVPGAPPHIHCKASRPSSPRCLTAKESKVLPRLV